MTTIAQQLEQLEQDVLNYMKVTAASGQSMREAIDRFAAIRAAVGGEGVPVAGYVLVPKEPTAEMLDAAIDVHRGFSDEMEVDAVWAAMLEAVK